MTENCFTCGRHQPGLEAWLAKAVLHRQALADAGTVVSVVGVSREDAKINPNDLAAAQAFELQNQAMYREAITASGSPSEIAGCHMHAFDWAVEKCAAVNTLAILLREHANEQQIQTILPQLGVQAST